MDNTTMPTGIDLKEAMYRLREVGGQQTIDHSFNVSSLMERFAHVLGEDAATYGIAGLLHDIGKGGVPSEIIMSQSPLTQREFQKVKSHVTLGAGILWSLKMWRKNGKVQAAHKAAAIACSDYHHAWYDGTHDCPEHKGGYYRGMKDHEEFTMKGEKIPRIARACALCDVFEAITANRSYDAAHTKEEALDIMCCGFNRQFDPSLFFPFFVDVIGFSKEQVTEALKRAIAK